MYSKKYIGLSMSFCIRDILDGKVKIEDVVCIVANTAFSSIELLIENYSVDYWHAYAKDDIQALLEKLWPTIYQPRMVYPDSMFSIAHGYWFDASKGELVWTFDS